jgi:hypothetical protein
MIHRYEGETDSDSDYEENSDEEVDEIDVVYYNDYDKLKYKKDKSYYIGMSDIIDDIHILSHAITPNSFFKCSYDFVLNYLYMYSIFRPSSPRIDILQLDILDDGTYSVIIKTYWLRLVQRHWKKICKDRYSMLLRRGGINAQKTFSMEGKYPAHLRRLPSIYGMLNVYSRK